MTAAAKLLLFAGFGQTSHSKVTLFSKYRIRLSHLGSTLKICPSAPATAFAVGPSGHRLLRVGSGWLSVWVGAFVRASQEQYCSSQSCS
jgi:hypothetical protein